MTAVWAPELVTDELLALTHALGEPGRELALPGEGNTSQRLADGRLVIKTSGVNLGDVTRDDFVAVDVDELSRLLEQSTVEPDALTRALDADNAGGVHRRASLESLMHAAIQSVSPVAFIGHTHPTAMLGLLCSIHAATAFDSPADIGEAIGLGRPLYIPYAQPGIELGRAMLASLRRRVDEHGQLPALILLGNHGVVATGATGEAVQRVTRLAVRAAQVRVAAWSIGGLVPMRPEQVEALGPTRDLRAAAPRGA